MFAFIFRYVRKQDKHFKFYKLFKKNKKGKENEVDCNEGQGGWDISVNLIQHYQSIELRNMACILITDENYTCRSTFLAEEILNSLQLIFFSILAIWNLEHT